MRNLPSFGLLVYCKAPFLTNDKYARAETCTHPSNGNAVAIMQRTAQLAFQ